MARVGILRLLVLVVVVLVVRQLSRQGTSPRFRIVVLVLFGILLLLAGLGVYSTWRQPQSFLPQTEFASQRATILETLRGSIDAGEYSEAYTYARRYREVQDPALERLRQKAHEGMLLEKIEVAAPEEPGRVAQLYSQLAELAPQKGYADLADKWLEKARKREQQHLQTLLAELPADQHPVRWLIYRRLHQLVPENPQFAKREEELAQALGQLVQASPWRDVCSSSAVRFCRFKGFTAFDPVAEERLGGILGVAWRSKGSLITADSEQTAPENAYYYIILPATGRVELSKTAQTTTVLPQPLQPWRERLLGEDMFPVAQ
mgnify:CR=1 FL=1